MKLEKIRPTVSSFNTMPPKSRKKIPWLVLPDEIVRILESDVFERRASTGSEPFFLLICLEATKFVLLIVLTLKETICPRICRHSRPKSAKSPLPVNVRRLKKALLKLSTRDL